MTKAGVLVQLEDDEIAWIASVLKSAKQQRIAIDIQTVVDSVFSRPGITDDEFGNALGEEFDWQLALKERANRVQQLQIRHNKHIQSQRSRLLHLILDKNTRKRVFEPAFDDQKHQLLLALQSRTKGAQRRIKIAFACRVAILIAESFRVMVAEKFKKVGCKLIPAELKRWWLS